MRLFKRECGNLRVLPAYGSQYHEVKYSNILYNIFHIYVHIYVILYIIGTYMQSYVYMYTHNELAEFSEKKKKTLNKELLET